METYSRLLPILAAASPCEMPNSSMSFWSARARSIAQERVRKYHRKTPDLVELEKSLTEKLGTRVIIEPNADGGRLLIDFFSPEELNSLVTALAMQEVAQTEDSVAAIEKSEPTVYPNTTQVADDPIPPAAPEEPDEDLYSVTSFSI